MIRGQELIIWIKNKLLDFIYAYFFDLMDVACANSYIVYNMIHLNVFILLNFKTIV